MNVTITLTAKQSAAFVKRVTGGATEASLAATIVVETAQRWADDDYQQSSAALVAGLKDQPQEVLDGITAQLSALV